MMKKRASPEADFQRTVCVFLDLQLPKGAIYHHSPNEGMNKVQYRKKQLAMGMKPGWPDLEIFCNGKVLFLELKSPTGYASKTQKEIHSTIDANGFKTFVCRTINDVKAALQYAGMI